MSEAGSRLSRMSYDGFAVPFLVSHGLLYHMDWNDRPKSRVSIDMDSSFLIIEKGHCVRGGVEVVSHVI